MATIESKSSVGEKDQLLEAKFSVLNEMLKPGANSDEVRMAIDECLREPYGIPEDETEENRFALYEDAPMAIQEFLSADAQFKRLAIISDSLPSNVELEEKTLQSIRDAIKTARGKAFISR